MAKRIFQVPTFTPTATADTTNLANNTHMSIGASGATAGLNVIEIYEGGQATASNAMIMMFARDVVLAGTPTALAATIHSRVAASRMASNAVICDQRRYGSTFSMTTGGLAQSLRLVGLAIMALAASGRLRQVAGSGLVILLSGPRLISVCNAPTP